jgi:DNA (cytosine-5)-methyltransferase 1
MLNGLDLFSGIGGISLALSPWVRPVAYCENDQYAQSVLLSRMAGGQLYPAPIWDDVRTLRGADLPEVDLIAGGFPCQDISEAGTGRGLAGERSGLVFELLRLVRECRPGFVFLENVPAIDLRGLDRILLEFAALGYDARWTIVSAAEVGAPHRRERWWLLAHANGKPGGLPAEERSEVPEIGRMGKTMADAMCEGFSRGRSKPDGENRGEKRGEPPASGWWISEPALGRVAHGVPNRVGRLRALGNAVVPQAAREAFIRLAGVSIPLSGLSQRSSNE